MNAEPRLEDLSAYVDQELTGTARQELEAHLQTCEMCRRRLEALRQTVTAVKGLPTEAPPRPFTVPPMRRQRATGPGWAWAGGALAAACLVLVVTVALTHVPHLGGGGASTATFSLHAPEFATQDRNKAAAPAPGLAYSSNSQTVTDPQNGSVQLTLSTAGRTYAASGSLQVDLILRGVSGDAVPVSLDDAGIRLLLQRHGYGMSLQNPAGFSASRDGSQVRISAVYRLKDLSLPGGAPGDYTLMATWQGPDRSATNLILVAQLPITLSG